MSPRRRPTTPPDLAPAEPLDGPMSITTETPRSTTFTTSDGTTLRVLETGSPDAQITVVLLHGWTLSKHAWDRVVSRLPEAAGTPVRTVRFDLRGHGESAPGPEGTATIQQCADDLAELIADRVPEGPIVLAGHSMGGMTLMALAEQHRRLFDDRVAGVALVATSSGNLATPSFGLPRPIRPVAHRLDRMLSSRVGASRGRRLSRRAGWMRPGLRWLLFGSRPAAADVEATAEWVARCHPGNMGAFRLALAEHNRLEALEALRSVPTVVLAGLADRLCPRSHARRIADALPDAQLLFYPGAGHMLPLERDDEVTGRIAALARSAAYRR
jgi:pimeloyl-ACP methyl ester carboxylesterase